MALPAEAPRDPRSPFIGLRPFDEVDAPSFFGRDEQTDELLRRLGLARFLAVIGTSGCGKSSLVRAGLIPSLKRGYLADAGTRWKIAVMRPGSDPLGALAATLEESSPSASRDDRATTLRQSSLGLVKSLSRNVAADESFLLVVDQFEEIFRFRTEARSRGAQDEADAFVKLLLAATEQDEVPIYVVLTMRSDYLGDCAVFRGLPEALNDAQYLVPVLVRRQLREVVEGPVRACGARIDPEVVQRVLNDVGQGLEQELDQLPVLQHALMRTWEEAREAESIGLEHYERAGEMSEALDRHAHGLYDGLAEEDRRIARRVFQRLSEKESLGRDIRRPTPLGELQELTDAPRERLVSVIEHFQHFLTSPSAPPFDDASVIDITHEALIRQWGDLAQWRKEEAHAAEVYERLDYDAERGARSWEDPDLAEASRLAAGGVWNATWATRYTPDEEAYPRANRFLTASEKHQSRKRLRRRLLILAAVAVPLLAGLGLLEVARQRAERASAEAELKIREAELEQTRASARSIQAEADRLLAEAERSGEERAAELRQEAERLTNVSAELARSAESYQTLSQRREKELMEARSRLVAAESARTDLAARNTELVAANRELARERDDLADRLAEAEKRAADLADSGASEGSPSEQTFWTKLIQTMAWQGLGATGDLEKLATTPLFDLVIEEFRESGLGVSRGKVDGRVVDSHGHGLAGMRVSASRSRRGDEAAVTDLEGRFALVTSGRSRICLSVEHVPFRTEYHELTLSAHFEVASSGVTRVNECP